MKRRVPAAQTIAASSPLVRTPAASLLVLMTRVRGVYILTLCLPCLITN